MEQILPPSTQKEATLPTPLSWTSIFENGKTYFCYLSTTVLGCFVDGGPRKQIQAFSA